MPPFKLSDLAKLNLFLAGGIAIFILGIAITLLAAGYPLKEVIKGVLGLVLGLVFIWILILALDEAPNPSRPKIRRGQRLSNRRR
jgi:hypothetical protein